MKSASASIPRPLHWLVILLVAATSFLTTPHARAGDRPDIYTFTAVQRADLYTQMSNYISSAIILDHLNPPNDKHGTARFTVWHRAYIKGLEDYLISQNRPQFVPLPKWNPATPIPAEFLVGGGVDPDCPTAVFTGHNCNALANSNPGIALPASLSTNLCTQTPFSTFRSTLENSYHNGVHVAVGGAMGAFKSPAAPIFWLWHAFVDDIWFDWQCSCGLDEGAAFNTYTAAERITDLKAGIADAWIRDSDADVASEPNLETGAILWESKDIWVRNSPATPVGTRRYLNEHQHQNPEYAINPANRPYIYVKVRNRGCTTISGQLRVYWANASTGLTWPTNFTEVSTSPVNVNSLSAGREHVGQFHWLDIPVPGGAGGSHFCLIARFVASPNSADPLTGEALNVSVDQNVKNSNQIAWKNLTIVDNIANLFPVIVRNISRNGGLVSLRFAVPAEQRDDNYFQHGTVAIDLGELYPRWLQNGAMGNGIKLEPGSNMVRILRPDATIDGIPMAFNDQALVNMQFGPGLPPCADDITVFNVRLDSYEGDTLLGGNTYEIRPEAIRPSPPVVVVAQGPQTTCNLSSVLLQAVASPPPNGSILSYLWFRDGMPLPNATQMTFLATTSGQYSVLVRYSNGCDRLSAAIPVYIGARPTNDSPCTAIVVALDEHLPFDIHCATAQPGEVSPGPGSGPGGGCNSHDGWCANDIAVQNSVWYLFTAPPSGVVTIHAGHHDHDGDHNSLVNTQLAVWRASNCANFSTYQLVAANDDSGNHGIWGTDPALHDLSGLVPGADYYIQIDGYRGALGAGMLIVEAGAPVCPCDWNHDGMLNSQDFFDFVVAFFTGQGEFNNDGVFNSQDFFDFIVCFFTSCP